MFFRDDECRGSFKPLNKSKTIRRGICSLCRKSFPKLLPGDMTPLHKKLKVTKDLTRMIQRNARK